MLLSHCSILTGDFGPEDYGCLADAITLSLPKGMCSEGETLLLKCLHFLLGPSLSIRLCDNQENALKILKKFENDLKVHKHVGFTSSIAGLRIWPLNSLKVAGSRSSSFNAVMKKFTKNECSDCEHSWEAIDPMDCIQIVSNTHIPSSIIPSIECAVSKACGTYLLAADDSIARNIINCLLQESAATPNYSICSGCITSSGNIHTIGGMTVGEKIEGGSQQLPISHLNDYSTLNKCIISLKKRKKDILHELRKNEEHHRCLLRLFDSIKYRDDLNIDLSKSEQRIKHATEELNAKEIDRSFLQQNIDFVSERLQDIESAIKSHKNSCDVSNEMGVASACYNENHLTILEGKARDFEHLVKILEAKHSDLLNSIESSSCDVDTLLESKAEIDLQHREYSLKRDEIHCQIQEIEQELSHVDISQNKCDEVIATKEKLETEVVNLQNAELSIHQQVEILHNRCKVQAEKIVQETCTSSNKTSFKLTNERRNLISKLFECFGDDCFDNSKVSNIKNMLRDTIQAEFFPDSSSLCEKLRDSPILFRDGLYAEFHSLLCEKGQLRHKIDILRHDLSTVVRSQLKDENENGEEFSELTASFSIETCEVKVQQKVFILESLKQKFEQVLSLMLKRTVSFVCINIRYLQDCLFSKMDLKEFKIISEIFISKRMKAFVRDFPSIVRT